MALHYGNQGNMDAGVIYGCRGGAWRWGWDACMYGSSVPRLQVCLSRYWAREGTGGHTRWALCTSAAAGGQLLTATGRNPQLGGRSETARYMTNEQNPPKVRASRRNSSRQSLHPVGARNLRKGPDGVVEKRSSTFPLARAWCINMHQLGVIHCPMDPKNFWDCCSRRLTRGCQVCRAGMGMQGGQGKLSRRGTRRAWEMTLASRGRLTRHTPSPVRTFRRANSRASVLSGAPTE